MAKSIVMSPLLLALLCMVTTSSVATDVLVMPLNETREFVCASPPRTGYSIAWGVNGTSATSSQFHDYIVLGEEVHIENGGLERNLTFIADIRANNTHILCAVIYIYGREYLVPVDMNLTLQGQLPPPVVTYEMSSDHHSVMFSWSAPFTLNISDMEPDILHYVVYIISDDGHNDTVNTTDTHYELQADPHQSHQFHVEIAAVNVLGEGEKYMSPEINLQGTFDVQNVSTTIHDQHSGYADITCHFAKQSDAKGCRIVVQTQNNATFCEFIATREERDESTVTVALPSGTYTLLVNDDEDGGDSNPAFNTTLTVYTSAQVSGCKIVQSNDGDNIQSTLTNYLLVVVSPMSAVILIAVVTTAIIFTCVCKYKIKKHSPPNTKENCYTSSPVQQSSSSESTDSSSVSSGSVSSGQSTGVHSTGRSYDLQYADANVPGKHTMASPPPTSNDELVNYALKQHQDTLSRILRFFHCKC